MRNIRFHRPRPGTTIAFVALTVALSGTAVALPGSNTVTSGDIKNKQVKRADLASNAVTSAKVKDGKLLAKDFKAGQLPAGAKGDRGDRGDTGTPGQTGGQGPIGPRGPSNLRVAADSVINLETCTDPDLSSCPPLLSRTLTTGTFLIQAKFTIDNDDNVPSSTANVCGLLNGFDGTIDRARTATLNITGSPGEIESVSLSGVSDSPIFAQTISLRCTSQAGEVMDLDNVRITALQVENVVGP